MFRPAQLVRRVRPLAGRAAHPRAACARASTGAGTTPRCTQGSNHLRYRRPELTLRLNTDAPITYLLDEHLVLAGRPISFLLGPDETLAGGIDDTAREFEEETARYWRHWTRAPGAAAGVAGRGDPRRHHAQAVRCSRTPAPSSRR